MPPKKPQPGGPSLHEVLDDLCMRFLVNLPAVEYESFERLFFAIESAHWFYDDFYRENDPSLPRLPLKHFAAKLFSHTALLRHHRDDVDRLTAQFQSYKQEVPTCGAALLNPSMDKVLLVRAWGSNARWGFPKGKLSKDETELDAAVREVLEETGFDIAPHVDESSFFVDSMSSGRYSRIFIVTDIPEDTVFETRTRKEISDIKWVPIAALPDAPKLAKIQQMVTLSSTGPHREDKVQKIFFSQYGVAPYAKRIRSWIKRRKKPGHGEDQENVVTAKELEDTLLSQPCDAAVGAGCSTAAGEESHCKVGPSTDTTLPNNVMSVEELEATLIPSNSETQGKRKGAKSKASPDVSGKEGNRKSRREVSQEEMRNRTTFGVEGGSRMNISERDSLFRQYVLETDRIAAERGLRDDLWPVPYVTSKDFTEEQLRAAEQARASREAELRDKAPAAFGAASQRPHERAHRNAFVTSSLTRTQERRFVFDRAAIMACINTLTTS